MSTPLHQMQVPAEWVAHGSLGSFPKLFGYDQKPAEVREMQGRLAIVFPSLEDQAELIYAVPGIVDWFRELYAKIPHFPYFLVPNVEAGALQSILISGMASKARDQALTSGVFEADDQAIAWTLTLMAATARYATHMGDDWEPVVRALLSPLGADTDYFVEQVAQVLDESP
ncbi:hypothetical protein BJY16_005313 [Actinoplanes octamycinicus]|uniref:Uncharacterized protein n=1 Tax=Actinoplanes octamycinicus TaxID=135948 RepID=A0A7W7H106_9ACTN|nr:hypothetical protein [Actinoplanes octamycinicus]MBB4741854.1 hypothetical protein [Actinoplanes octamycinicus]GIE60618.1 hypothetical protein Aoc01nite_60200 [Actinoplanes octamycinicus]